MVPLLCIGIELFDVLLLFFLVVNNKDYQFPPHPIIIVPQVLSSPNILNCSICIKYPFLSIWSFKYKRYNIHTSIPKYNWIFSALVQWSFIFQAQSKLNKNLSLKNQLESSRVIYEWQIFFIFSSNYHDFYDILSWKFSSLFGSN